MLWWLRGCVHVVVVERVCTRCVGLRGCVHVVVVERVCTRCGSLDREQVWLCGSERVCTRGGGSGQVWVDCLSVNLLWLQDSLNHLNLFSLIKMSLV